MPCNDVQASKTFYMKLGFTVPWEDEADPQGYVILGHPSGAALHLNKAVDGWLIPGRNPFGRQPHSEDRERLGTSAVDQQPRYRDDRGGRDAQLANDLPVTR
ncbi:MAG: hypothetical protein ABI548_23490 [Polyangiaceae bacterium]